LGLLTVCRLENLRYARQLLSLMQPCFDAEAGGKAATYILALNAVRKQMEDRWWKEPRVDSCFKATKQLRPAP
jgi:hypothetical protein